MDDAINARGVGVNRRSGWLTAGGLVLTLGVGSLPFPAWDDEFAGVGHLVGNELIYWGLTALVLFYVRRVEGRPLESIGLRRPALRDLLAALAVAVVTLAGLAAIFMLIFPALGISEGGAVDRLRAAPTWWLIASVLRAGVSEEVLFRGYPIERLRESSGSRTLAAAVSLLAFTVAHAGSWGATHMAVAAFGGLTLTLLYWWRGNLWGCMAAHCLVDGLALL